ncbi:MAG: hypothetical protein CMJ78_14125 [Planctomycetaceae bacterium]|nr:hypothetical protein [Planctomycetaceae bacterium]
MKLQIKLWQRFLVSRHRRRRERASRQHSIPQTQVPARPNFWALIKPYRWWACGSCIFAVVLSWAAWTTINRQLPSLSEDPDLASAEWVGAESESLATSDFTNSDESRLAPAMPFANWADGGVSIEPEAASMPELPAFPNEIEEPQAPNFPTITTAGFEAASSQQAASPNLLAPVIQTSATQEANRGAWLIGTIEEVEE